jgi:hypothetical protein
MWAAPPITLRRRGTEIEDIDVIQRKRVICPGRTPKTGKIIESNIICECCNEEFSPSRFEVHSDGTWHRPWLYIFLVDTERNLKYYKNQSLHIDGNLEGGDLKLSDVVPQSNF